MLHVCRIPFTVHCPLFSAFLLSIYRFRCFACVAAFAVHPRCLNWKLKNCLLQFVATIGWPYTVAGDAPSLSVAVSHRTCHSPRTRLASALCRYTLFALFELPFGIWRCTCRQVRAKNERARTLTMRSLACLMLLLLLLLLWQLLLKLLLLLLQLLPVLENLAI